MLKIIWESASSLALLNIRPFDPSGEIFFEYRDNYTQPGTITINDTVFAYGEYTFTDDIVVNPGGYLYTQRAYNGRTTHFSFGSNAGIIVQNGGHLLANKTDSHQPVFTSVGTQKWDGITYIGDHLTDYFSGWLTNAHAGIRVDHGSLNIDKAIISNCDYGVVYLGSSGNVCNGTMIRSNKKFGVYLIDSGALVNNCDISGNYRGGMRIWRANNNHIAENQIYNNGINDHTGFHYWAGIELLEGAASLSCNTIQNNAGAGLMVFGQTYVNMTDWAINSLKDNVQSLNQLGFDYGQMTLIGGTANVTCGAEYVL